MRQLTILLSLLLSLFCFAVKAQTDSTTIILRSTPYLQNPTDGGITICWQTSLPSYSYVEWGVDTLSLSMARTLIAGQSVANNTTNKIRINGLQGGTKYYYRIVSRHIRTYQAYKKEFGGTYTSPFYSFTLPSDSQSNFDALIFNDLHQNTTAMEALMEVVRSRNIKYNIVFFNGDCIDDPVDEDQAITTMHSLNSVVGSTSTPVIYMRGNHEIRNAYSVELTKLFDYVGGQSYGAMSIGDTRIVMLDCGEDKPDDHWVYYGMNDFTGFRAEQLAFLKLEHKSKNFINAKKRILIHHIPLWGLIEDEPNNNFNPCLELWGDELSKQPYDISINAHTHRAKLYKKGEIKNPFPIAIGGGCGRSKMDGSSVIHLSKRNNNLSVCCYNHKGDVLWQTNL